MGNFKFVNKQTKDHHSHTVSTEKLQAHATKARGYYKVIKERLTFCSLHAPRNNGQFPYVINGRRAGGSSDCKPLQSDDQSSVQINCRRS